MDSGILVAGGEVFVGEGDAACVVRMVEVLAFSCLGSLSTC